MPEMSIQIIQEHLAEVTAWFEESFHCRLELGASVSVWQHGRELLNLNQGHCDRARTREWNASTLVPVWSMIVKVSPFFRKGLSSATRTGAI